MPTLAERSKGRKKLTILGYGAAMSGKTRFIISMRKVFRGPCYIFNFDMEDNLLPLLNDPAMGDVEYDQYNNEKGYDNIVTKIVQFKRSCPYGLIVLENLNVMYRVLMEHTLRIAQRVDTDGARIQDWGLTNKRLLDRLKEVLELPCPIYATSHEQREKEEASGRFVGSLLIPSKELPAMVPAMFNVNLRFYSIQNPGTAPEYWVQCAGDGTFVAGDKTGTLAFREKPDFVEMAKKMGPQYFQDAPKPAGVAVAPTITTGETKEVVK